MNISPKYILDHWATRALYGDGEDMDNDMNCNMNAFFLFNLFMVYIPECKHQLKTKKQDTQIRDIAHFKSGL